MWFLICYLLIRTSLSISSEAPGPLQLASVNKPTKINNLLYLACSRKKSRIVLRLHFGYNKVDSSFFFKVSFQCVLKVS